MLSGDREVAVMRDLPQIPVFGQRAPKVFTSYAWSTEHEIAFIDGLGKHSELGLKRKDLLVQYAKAAIARNDWGRIDPAMVQRHVAAALRLLLNG